MTKPYRMDKAIYFSKKFINFGTIATGNLIIDTSYAVDNRETGYVLSGMTPNSAARTRMIKEAIANESETSTMNRKTDFSELKDGDGSSTQIRDDSIYNHTENVEIKNTRLVSRTAEPTITVYTRNYLRDTETPLFKDVPLDDVSMRMEDDAAVFTWTKDGNTETATVRKKLVSALIARGGSEKEKLFENLWAGPLENAIVQIEPVCAPGLRLTTVGGEKTNRTRLNITVPGNVDAQKWWSLCKMVTEKGIETYAIDVTNGVTSITVSNRNNVTSGSDAMLFETDRELNQRWIFERQSGTTYIIRNAANPNVSLDVYGGGTADGTSVVVWNYNANDIAQQWKLSLLTAESFSKALDLGRAVEFVPGNAPRMRMALPRNAKTGQGVSLLRDSIAGNAQSWRLEPVGTDSLSGVSTTYYRVVEKNTGLALSVQGGALVPNANVIAETPSNNNVQYWYLLDTPDGDSDCCILAARGNTAFAVSPPDSGNPSIGAALRLNANTGGDYQKWKLSGLSASEMALAAEEADDPLDGKTFTMETKLAPGMVADAFGSTYTAVKLQEAEASTVQQWTFKEAGTADLDGVETPYYMIENVNAGTFMSLTTTFGGYSLHYYVQQDYSGANDISLQWFAVKDADGFYTIVSRQYTSHCFDVSVAGTAAGAMLNLNTRSDTDAQKWKLTEVTEVADRFDGKVFTIASDVDRGKNLDISGSASGAGKTNGEPILIYTAGETESQRWRFLKQGETYLNGRKQNYYSIQSVYALGRALDTSGNTAKGTRPWIWDCGNNQNQYWFVESDGRGAYQIIPRTDTTKCLVLSGGGTRDNTAVVLWNKEDNRSDAKWRLTETVAPEKVFTNVWLESVGAPGNCIDLLDFTDTASSLARRPENADGSSHWTFEKMGTNSHGDYYRIWNHRYTNRVLEVGGTGQNVREGSLTMTSTWEHGATDQLWYLDKAGYDGTGDYYYITSYQNTNFHLAVNASGGIATSSSTSDNAKWRINELFDPVTVGTYEIGSAAAITMRMEAGNSTNVGGDLKVYHREEGTI